MATLRLIFAAALLRISASDEVVVASSCGSIRGKLQPNGVSSFYAIPFAKPPVGPRRWALPESADCSASGIIDATTPGNICWQYAGGCDFCSEARAEKQNEDCLTLDVHSKFAKGDKQPVIVFLHGGSLISGDSTVYQHIDNLAADGDVVLVVDVRQ
jgi:para-nitrobenzyl esterase